MTASSLNENERQLVLPGFLVMLGFTVILFERQLVLPGFLLDFMEDVLFKRLGSMVTPITEDEKSSTQNTKETKTGWSMNLDRNMDVMPTTRLCFYCSEEGKEHPLEHFVCYPCCFHILCRDCMWKQEGFCGECLTEIPQDNKNAILWIRDRLESSKNLRTHQLLHLLGRTYVLGYHTFLDEIILEPLYGRLQPSCTVLAVMNPSDVQQGVHYLEWAAQAGVKAAMLDLAHVYSSSFNNSSFQKDKDQAEFWFQRAIGIGNEIFPLALTYYGDFLSLEPSRGQEAKNMFKMAASLGHARGQYEYAMCLLHGLGKNKIHDSDDEPFVCTNENRTEAIRWLCKASEHGLHIPAYLELAKLLIEIFEKEFGRADFTGYSPLPRALQMLSLVQDGEYGNSNGVRKEAADLLARYESCRTRCANCGDTGSEKNRLRQCMTCCAVSYCSQICTKRHFRDGHRNDCCSSVNLFDFHSIKLSLPWTCALMHGVETKLTPLRLPSTQKERTLMQMVEDDTDEVYGEEELDYDDHLLTQLMLRMRMNVETFLERELKNIKPVDLDSLQPSSKVENKIASDISNLKLYRRINMFAEHTSANQDFIKAMHKVRELGNAAVHPSPEKSKLNQEECEKAVGEYRYQKERYEIYKSKKEIFSSKEGKTAVGSNDTSIESDSRNSASTFMSQNDPPEIQQRQQIPIDFEACRRNGAPLIARDQGPSTQTMTSIQESKSTNQNLGSTPKQQNRGKKKKKRKKKTTA